MYNRQKSTIQNVVYGGVDPYFNTFTGTYGPSSGSIGANVLTVYNQKFDPSFIYEPTGTPFLCADPNSLTGTYVANGFNGNAAVIPSPIDALGIKSQYVYSFANVTEFLSSATPSFVHTLSPSSLSISGVSSQTVSGVSLTGGCPPYHPYWTIDSAPGGSTPLINGNAHGTGATGPTITGMTVVGTYNFTLHIKDNGYPSATGTNSLTIIRS